MGDPTAMLPLDADVIERLRRVSTATLTMVLIKQGVRTSWLRGPVPLDPIGRRIVGPAFTIRFVPGREDLSGPESYARSPSFRDAIEAAPGRIGGGDRRVRQSARGDVGRHPGGTP